MKRFKGRNGPWHYDDELSGVYSESCRFVCDVTDKDNGILIAAAPELLEALQDALHAYDKHGEYPEWDFARAVINKSLGE